MGNVLLAVTVAACWFNAGAISLAQHNWQLFRYVGPSEFGEFHARWLRGLSWAGLPMSFVALIGNGAQLWWWHTSDTAIVVIVAALALQLVMYAATAVWWGPAQNRMHHARLADGGIDPLYRRLCTSNWIRVALVSTVAVLQTVLLVDSLR